MMKQFLLFSAILLLSLASYAQNSCVPAYVAKFNNNADAVTLADFNNDGILDIAVCQESNDRVSVMLNSGPYAFQPAVACSVGVDPVAITHADMNGDGSQDIITANNGSDNISILFNNGNGTFAPSINFLVANQPLDLAAGDLDGDGDMDIAVARDTAVSVLINPGNGILNSPVGYYFMQYYSPEAITITDADGDTDLDIAVSENQVAIILNNGNGTFAAAAYYGSMSSGGSDPSYLDAADLDGDNDKDLVAGLFDDGLYVFLNNGNGTYANPQHYPLSNNNSLYGVALADIDQDGDTDIGIMTSSFAVMLNNGNGSFASPVSYATGGYPAFGDMDGDTQADVVLAGGSLAIVMHGNGNGTFEYPPGYNYGGGRCMTAADFNGDGSRDIALGLGGNGGLRIILNNGSGGFSSSADYPAGNMAKYVHTADLDGDTDMDLALIFQDNVYVMYNNGSGNFSVSTNFPVSNVSCLAINDYDNDGDIDLAVTTDTGIVFKNNGSGIFTPASLGGGYYFSSMAEMISADFNGDNYPDLARDASGGFRIALNNGNGTFSQGWQLSNNTIKSFVAADVDQDGDMDIAGFRDSLLVYFNNGSGLFLTHTGYPLFNTNGQGQIVTGDWNQDGIPDLAISNAHDGPSVSYFINNGSGAYALSHTYYTCGGAMYMVAGDFDGTGTDDVVADGGYITALLNCSGLPNVNVPEENIPAPACLVYPNPLSTTATVDLKNFSLSGGEQFQLINLHGAVVRSYNVIQPQFQLEKGELTPGIYFYRLISENGAGLTGKVLVQ